MKVTTFVPLSLLTCSAFPTRKGERKWHRKPENREDAEKLRRLMKVNDMKHDVGVLQMVEDIMIGKRSRMIPPRMVMRKPILRASDTWPLPVRVVYAQLNS